MQALSLDDVITKLDDTQQPIARLVLRDLYVMDAEQLVNEQDQAAAEAHFVTVLAEQGSVAGISATQARLVYRTLCRIALREMGTVRLRGAAAPAQAARSTTPGTLFRPRHLHALHRSRPPCQELLTRSVSRFAHVFSLLQVVLPRTRCRAHPRRLAAIL